LFLKKATSR